MFASMSLKLLDRVVFKPGDVVFREGDVGNRAYVVIEGEVEVSKMAGEEKIVLEQVGAQGIFGEMALIDDRPRSATATAIQRTQCMLIH